jgi:hypothetical protein
MVIKLEHKIKKYENLIKFVDTSKESFTALKASTGDNLPNRNTTLHTLDGFVRAGLLTSEKSKEGKVFSKTKEWNCEKAIAVNKARIKQKADKRKKLKPAKKQKPKA